MSLEAFTLVMKPVRPKALFYILFLLSWRFIPVQSIIPSNGGIRYPKTQVAYRRMLGRMVKNCPL